MTLSDNDLREYQRIWKEEFQEEISIQDARHSASMLMELFALLFTSVSQAPPQESEGSLSDHRT
jgi:hypothetical protein